MVPGLLVLQSWDGIQHEHFECGFLVHGCPEGLFLLSVDFDLDSFCFSRLLVYGSEGFEWFAGGEGSDLALEGFAALVPDERFPGNVEVFASFSVDDGFSDEGVDHWPAAGSYLDSGDPFQEDFPDEEFAEFLSHAVSTARGRGFSGDS